MSEKTEDVWKDPPTEYYDNGVRFGTASEMIAELKKLRARAAMLEEVLQLGHEPFAVKYAKPAKFWNHTSPGYWYVAAVARNRSGLAMYLNRDGRVRGSCADGHFDTEADANAALQKYLASPTGGQGG